MASRAPHLVLLIGDEGVLCVPYHAQDSPMPFFTASGDSEGAAKIVALAKRNPRIRVTLLADTLAQDFRRDSVPRINVFDRAKLLSRRVQQAFPQARLTGSLPVKSDRTQIILAGLHGGGPVFDWLARLAPLRRKQAPRIALLPVECAAMVVQLLPEAQRDWALLLSRQRCGGFRQIVTYKGELLFSRLTPPLPPQAQPAEIAESLSHDIQATRGYLSRLGLSDNLPLRGVLLMPENCHAALRRADLLLHERLLLSPHDAAVKLDLPFAPQPADAYGDLLFAQWFARRKPRMPLMPAELRRVQRTAVIRRLGMRAAIATFLFAIGMAGMDASDLATTLLTREQEAAQLAYVEQNLTRERAAAEPVTQPLGRLRQALERRRLFSEPVAMPWPALTGLAGGLGETARLAKLEWHDETGKPADENLHIKTRLADAPDPADREMTVARFRKLAENLTAAMPGYAVEVTRYPFPVLPHEALSNLPANNKETPGDPTAEFSIRRMP